MKHFAYLLLSAFLVSSCADDPAPVVIEPPGEFGGIEVKDAVVYELFIRDFTVEGNFNAILPRLDELKALGVNVIWFMPVHPIGELKKNGTYGSPYSVKDYYAVNSDFGTNDDFKNLVNEIHHRDMAVIIDWVANHTSWDNQWIYDHENWYTHDAAGNIIPPNPGWTDVADLNYDNDSMRLQMIDAMKYWIEEFDIDGYRCDASDMVPIDFWTDAIAELRAIKPLILLAEGAGLSLYSAGFDLTYAWSYYSSLKNVWNGSPVSTLQGTFTFESNVFPTGSLRFRFTTNHDETSWDNTPVVLFNGIDGAKAASVLATFTGGVPMIYNGQEVGSTQKLNLFEKIPINWNTYPEMRTFYTQLFGFYNKTKVMRTGVTAFLSTDADVAMIMRTVGTDTAFVLVNTRNSARSALLPSLMQNRSFTDMDDESVTTSDSITLAGYGYEVLVK